MQAREEQVARNEVRFRALNERLREQSGTWSPGEGRLELVCECGDADCLLAIELSVHEYELVRSDETHFLVVPGHERPEVEDVVGSNDGWLVVAKLGEAAKIAAQSDPRA